MKGISFLLFKRITLRHWLHAPRETLLQIAIFSLGIALFFSIRLANRAVLNNFEHFTTLLHQESDVELRATDGKLSTNILKELRQSLGATPVELIPILDLRATEPYNENKKIAPPLFQLLGVDLLALQNLRSPQELVDNPLSSIKSNVALFITHQLALEKNLAVGDFFPLVVDHQKINFQVAGWIPEERADWTSSSHLLLADLPLLQSLTNQTGKISQIACLLPSGPRREERKKELFHLLEEKSHGRFELWTARDEEKKAALMTQSFRMNLTILSFIALLAGLYLIFQSLDGALVRRRSEIAILSTLGVTERVIRIQWLLEALILGLSSGFLGSLLGWGGAQFAVRSVAAVVNTLYYRTAVHAASLDCREFFLAMLLALSSALLTGWWPAREAAQTPPAQILSQEYDKERTRSWVESLKLGCFFFLLSGMLSLMPAVSFLQTRPLPLAGYLATFLLILGGGIFSGRLVEQSASLSSSLGKFSPLLRLALSHLKPLSKRHYFAAAGILCGIAIAAGMLILIASFEKTMNFWIRSTFQADLYISSAQYDGTSLEKQIDASTWQRITTQDEIADFQVVTSHSIMLSQLPTMISGIDINFLKRHQNLLWKKIPPEDFFNTEKNSHLLLASESFLQRYHLRLGDQITIPSIHGNKKMTIVGIFAEYGNERGSLLMDRNHFLDDFKENGASALIIFLKPSLDPQAASLKLAKQFPGLTIFTNRNLREEILRIFHQTFSITYALELIGMIVAIIGLGMTLSNILIDRRKEVTILRALGATYSTIALAEALEGGILAMSSTLVGILVSIGIGVILIYVINKQSFGWTLQFTIPFMPLLLLGVAVVITATAVCYAVARKCSQLPEDIHE